MLDLRIVKGLEFSRSHSAFIFVRTYLAYHGNTTNNTSTDNRKYPAAPAEETTTTTHTLKNNDQVIRILDSFEHTKLQASAVTALFGRTWDLENFDAVFATLPAGVDKQAASRLG